MEKYKRGSSIWKYNPISRTFKLNNKLFQGLIVLEFLKPRIDYDNSKNYFKSSYFYFCNTHIFTQVYFVHQNLVSGFSVILSFWTLIQTLKVSLYQSMISLSLEISMHFPASVQW